MKRTLFLAGVGAIATAGCAHHGGGLIPQSRTAGAADLAAAFAAGPLPLDPILGEVRRFDDPVAPTGWMICDGSAHSTADNPALGRLLGTLGGTYKLPHKGAYGFVIAVAGTVPQSPAQLNAIFAKRAAARGTTATAS